MKKYFIILFLMIFLTVNVFSNSDMDDFANEENSFLITVDTITVQREQTELEKQSILGEFQYRVKIGVLESYISEIWRLFTSTAIMLYDLMIGLVIIIFLRGLIFLLIDFFPLIFKKSVNVISRWIR